MDGLDATLRAARSVEKTLGKGVAPRDALRAACQFDGAMLKSRPVAVVVAGLLGVAFFMSPTPMSAVERPRGADDARWVCRVGGPEVETSTPRRSPTLAAEPMQATTATADLRLALGRLLAEHAFLTMETMRAVAFGSPELQALRSGLDINTADLRGAIAGVYGADAGATFTSLWNIHIEALIEYARAKSVGDADAATKSQRLLDTYLDQFAAFLTKANPHLDAKAEAAALRLHVTQLTAISDSNYVRAYEAEREAFRHMFMMGDQLALALARQFPRRYGDALIAFSPRTSLRVTLDRLLGEHLVLAAESMRAGLAGTADFPAARQALAGNTADLQAGIAEYYGTEAGQKFGNVWREHVDAYIAFIEAVAAKDASARAASLNRLHVYHDQIAAFLSSANPYLDAPVVAALIRRHVQALISQVESAEAGDHERTVATIRGAYAQTFEVGDALAMAIARQFPDRFQDLKELPFTSTHGPESSPTLNLSEIALLAGLALLGAVALVRRLDGGAQATRAPRRGRMRVE
jgi:hypothetical protein